jgi:hypothetical protein
MAAAATSTTPTIQTAGKNALEEADFDTTILLM